MDKTTPHALFKIATEVGRLVIFFVANARFNLFVATGAFMVAIVAAMIASYAVTRHVPMMALVTGGIVIVFGTLTLALHDETFIKVKPRSEEHTSELQSHLNLVCRLLLEKKNKKLATVLQVEH